MLMGLRVTGLGNNTWGEWERPEGLLGHLPRLWSHCQSLPSGERRIQTV